MLDKAIKYMNEVGVPCRFFTGIVEDNNDPLHIGRLRIRIHNMHSEIKEETPTEGIRTDHLMWALPLLPPKGGAITGRGEWPDAPENGSLALCIFLDAPDYQLPIYLGVLPGGRRLEANTNIGFNDPEGLWPRTDRIPNIENSGSFGDAPYVKDESRKVLGLTYFDVVRADISQDNPSPVSGAFGNDQWQETGPESLPEGRYNSVEEHHPRDYTDEDNDHYKIGYTKEIDSTPNQEGVREYYAPSGSYRQVDAAGEESLRLRDGREHVIFEKDRQHIKGFQNVIIDNEQYVLVGQNKFQQIVGDLQESISNMRQEIENLKRVSAQTVTHNVSSRHNLTGDSNNRQTCNRMVCPFDGLLHSTPSNRAFTNT